MDVDPCTGETTDRIIAALGLRGGRNEQNKFEYRNDILSRYTREYRVVVEFDGVPKTRLNKNGLTMGEYVQPVNVWVHGEQDVPGVPPVPYDFSQMAFLTQGVGRDGDGNLWGPIQPFPQTGVLIEPPVCPESTSQEDMPDDTEVDEAPAVEVASVGGNGTVIARRGTVGRWYSRARKEALSDAENTDTTDPVIMEVAPQPERVNLTIPSTDA